MLRGRQLTVAMLSGLLVVGASTIMGARPARAAAQTTVVNVALKPTNETDLTNYV